MADESKPSYLDENLSEEEKKEGQTRLPMPNEEGNYPGKENRADKDFERPDEFGDGDRRS
jgi:hypothetical protein